MNALETYDQSIIAAVQKQSAAESGVSVDEVTSGLASTNITGEVSRLQEKQKAAIQKARSDSIDLDREEYNSSPDPRYPKRSSYVHPDLEDLQFGAIGASSSKLPPPLKPRKAGEESDEDDAVYRRGSLSDYSDYESSDEETHKSRSKGQPYVRRDYVTVSTDSLGGRGQRLVEEEDPFADPFADSAAVKV